MEPVPAETVEVVGTAPEARFVYPGAVSVVTSDGIEDEAPMSTTDVLRRVEGVHVVDEDGLGLRANIGLRGLPPARSTRVLVLEDGLPIAPGPYGHPELYALPSIGRLEAIEVVRGSGSIRFGPQTIGGVVNLVTGHAPARPAGEVEVQGGSYGWWGARAFAGDGGGSAFGWRADALHQRYTGPRGLDLVATDVAGRLEGEVGAGRLVAKLGLYGENSRPSYLGLTTPGFRADPSANPAIHDVFALDRQLVHVRWTRPIGARVASEAAVYGQQMIRTWGRQDYERTDIGADYERVVTGTPGAAPADDGSTLFFLDSNNRRDRTYAFGGAQEELVIRFGRADPLAGTARAGVRLHREHERQRQLAGATATDASGELTSDEVLGGDAVAGWAAVDAWALPWLRVDGGLRVEAFHASREMLRDEDPVTGLPGPSNVEADALHSAVLPGAGLGVRPGETVLLFAGVHRGWTPPATTDAITSDGTVLRLEAERSWNVEAGGRVGREHVGLDVTAFLLRFEDQVMPPAEAGAAAPDVVNGAPTLHRGLEASGRLGTAGDGWGGGVFAAWTLLDARFTAGPYDGNVLPYAPPELGHAGVRGSARGGVELRFVVAHVGSQLADPENTVPASTDGLVGRIPAFTTFDARLSVELQDRRGRGVRLFVAGDDLADMPYVASRAPAGIQPAGFRTVRLGIEAGVSDRRSSRSPAR